jgi:glutamate/tyrosine decarboxylase-like PLP-dependent enzyme
MTYLRDRLEKEKAIGRGVIVSYGLGEVNTGGIGSDLDKVADLCDELGAWLHVDAGTYCPSLLDRADRAAFGGFAGLAPGMSHLTKGMDKAHSLTLDGKSILSHRSTTNKPRS